jgi:hypothetical protein
MSEGTASEDRVRRAIGIQVTFDAQEPRRLAEFWATALDYVLQPPPQGFDTWEQAARAYGIPPERWGDIAAVVDPEGIGPRLLFLKVPEDKTAKNRVHLDVSVSGVQSTTEQGWARIEAHRDRLVAAGATVIEARSGVRERWIVLLDPEGNEFCVT